MLAWCLSHDHTSSTTTLVCTASYKHSSARALTGPIVAQQRGDSAALDLWGCRAWERDRLGKGSQYNMIMAQELAEQQQQAWDHAGLLTDTLGSSCLQGLP